MERFVSQIIEPLGGWVSPWVYGPIIIMAWVFGLILIKHGALLYLKKWVKKTSTPLDDAVVEAAQLPLTLLIFSSTLYLLQTLLPLSKKISQSAGIASKASIILAMIFFLDRMVREFGKMFATKSEFAFMTQKTAQAFLRAIVLGLGLLIFLDMLGISITPLLASLGIGSLTVGLALQDTMTNFFAGLYVSMDKPIRRGDFIKLESGEEGYVVDIGWRSTRVRMPSNNIIVVPNQKISSNNIVNYYLPEPELVVTFEMGVHYDSDLEKVEQVTVEVGKEIMKRVPGSVTTFEPLIRYHTFDASSINFTVVMRAKEFGDAALIKHEFIKALHKRYREEGINIPFPTRTLEISKESLDALKTRT